MLGGRLANADEPVAVVLLVTVDEVDLVSLIARRELVTELAGAAVEADGAAPDSLVELRCVDLCNASHGVVPMDGVGEVSEALVSDSLEPGRTLGLALDERREVRETANSPSPPVGAGCICVTLCGTADGMAVAFFARGRGGARIRDDADDWVRADIAAVDAEADVEEPDGVSLELHATAMIAMRVSAGSSRNCGTESPSGASCASVRGHRPGPDLPEEPRLAKDELVTDEGVCVADDPRLLGTDGETRQWLRFD